MELVIGQKVAYPSQGVCLVEDIERKIIGENSIMFYLLRVLGDDSTIFVPTENAENIGIRPIIGSSQFKKLISELEKDFDEISTDWKIRSREYSEKLQSGDVFEAADVLKKLTFLSLEKKLSFREQNLLDKAKFLIISEIVSGNFVEEEKIESKVSELVQCACRKHQIKQPRVMSASTH